VIYPVSRHMMVSLQCAMMGSQYLSLTDMRHALCPSRFALCARPFAPCALRSAPAALSRQFNDKFCTPGYIILNTDKAVVIGNNRTDDRQSEAHAGFFC